MRVLPTEAAIDKEFDYLVPDELGDQVRVGTRVRVDLHGRRVGAWVVADGVEPPPGVRLRPLRKVTGWGPGSDLVELAGWAAWRWAGRRAPLLAAASPATATPTLPARPRPVTGSPVPAPVHSLAAAALEHPRAVLRMPPAGDPIPVVVAAVDHATRAGGDALVVTPSVSQARALAVRLRRAGVAVAVLPEGWAAARAGGCAVVGARAGAWAPVPDLAAVVVLDEHDEALQEERAPTWHARDVAAERARRAGAPCLLVSPCPSLEALAWGRLVTLPRSEERAGWPVTQVVDMRREDPVRTGLWSTALVAALHRSRDTVVCVLNRKGRSRLLACRTCRELVRCEACGAAVAQEVDGALDCRRCGATRPPVCLACGASRFRNLRLGVTRAREELEALVGEPVAEVTATRRTAGEGPAGWGGETPRVLVGTEAVLHQVARAELVAFLDMDQELLAPRYRAGEQALALVARAARLVGGRASGGRILVQTHLPRHDVLVAAVGADPGRVATGEAERRRLLGWPPVTAMAEVSGTVADAFVEELRCRGEVELLGPLEGRWLVRAPDHQRLCDALAGSARPPGRLRVAVDPQRV